MRDCSVGTGYAGKYCVPDSTRSDAYANVFSTNILSLSGYSLSQFELHPKMQPRHYSENQ